MRKSIALAEWICVYCGQVGDSVDHIPPESMRLRLIHLQITREFPFLEVRACRECNSALNDDGGWTLRERKRFVKSWLARRYARLLSMPDWEPEELLELGPGLAIYVSSGVVKKRIIERRLKW